MGERLAETPEQSHLASEMLADLLSGDIESDDLRRRVIPHLLARCPVCRRRVEGIRRLQERFDHWNESVAVREGQDAPRLLAVLMEHPEEARLHRLVSEEDFHTWGLAQLLLQKSRKQVHNAPRAAVELAELAVVVADHLPGTAYHPEWVGDLKARSWAVLGNARRVVGELSSAEAAFRRALACLDGASTGRPWVRAEVMDLLASLRREQGRGEEAYALLDQAESVYRKTGDLHRVGRVLIKRAKSLEEDGRFSEVVDLLQQASSLLDPGLDAHLLASAQKGQTCALIHLGQFSEARAQMSGLWESYRWSELEIQRLRWMEAQIAQGLEEWDAAETLYSQIQTWFLDHELPFDAALVSLDLAVLYAQTGRDDDLQALAVQVLPLFQAQGVGREALAALLLFQQAVERKSLSVELLREVREVVRRRRPRPET